MVEQSCGRVGTNATRVRTPGLAREPTHQPESDWMPSEPLSPELALVDPELGARARAAMPEHPATYRRPSRPPRPAVLEAQAPADDGHRPYPRWARLTAALWLLVLGILIGGAAIPHAQDRPRVVPPSEDAPAVCKVPEEDADRPGPRLAAPSGPLDGGYTPPRGAIAQLGERLDRTQEVAGSSPASSIAEPAGNGGFPLSRRSPSSARETES